MTNVNTVATLSLFDDTTTIQNSLQTIMDPTVESEGVVSDGLRNIHATHLGTKKTVCLFISVQRQL